MLGNNGIYKSIDNGTTWTPANNGFLNTFARKLFSTGNALFASMENGVYVSINQGSNWIELPTLPDNDVKAFEVLDNELYVATAGAGVWKGQLSELTTGIGSNLPSNMDVGLYPNPSTGDINLTFSDKGVHTVNVFDSNGKMVKTLESAEFLNLNISGKGIFYLQVIQQDKVVVKKVVIQ